MALEWFKKLIPSKNDRELKKLQPIVDRVNSLEEGNKKLDDATLARKTVEFRERLDKGETLDALLPEAFAAVREAAWRVMKMRHYDVQIIGGHVLHSGMIAEMKTGEGKTLVATLPLYLHALENKGAHLVTVNDYLAARDAEWMSEVYQFMGMSVGTILSDISDQRRKAAYNSDITYGTNNEFGFDYLRDNMKFRYEQYVHRYFEPDSKAKDETERNKILNFAIVDEVDSVLIDEARTPLIISGPAAQSSDLYHRINGMVPFLRRDEDFLVDEKAHSVTLTESGVDKVESRLEIDNLYDGDNILIQHHVNQALKAHFLYKRDVNYLVENSKVIIVDEFTGRKMPGRRWSDGLHQAVEAKEGVKVEQENQTLATITFQNFFRMYKTLSGMTGTAETEAAEFASIYSLDCRVIPTNCPLVRIDSEDLVYKNERMKLKAVVDDILQAHEKGQPVLVGTASVENSEKISKVLDKRGVKHSVLNAKQHGREAHVIAQAGLPGNVTIATNMAGRGTDIMLGGNPKLMVEDTMGDAPEKDEEGWDEYQAELARFTAECEEGKLAVISSGGLHIIGTERHESRRIDNQLRGRAGRQGDPGSSRFYLSLEDDLMRIFGGERISKIMEMLNVPEDEPIEHKMVTKSVENAQRKVEGQNFDIRKNVLEYDDVMNLQRRTIYGLRRAVLEGTRTHELVMQAIGDVAHGILDQHCPESLHSEEWNMAALKADFVEVFRDPLDFDEPDREFDPLFEFADKELRRRYLEREERLVRTIAMDHEGEEDALAIADNQWRFYEREQYLRSLDSLWKAHLVQMDHLRTGVHLNAYAQKDPKLIYKKEGYEIFQDLVYRIKREAVRRLFYTEVKSEAEIDKMKERKSQDTTESRGGGEGRRREKQRTVKRSRPKIGRNDPCHCGSGKKYKKCHMQDDLAVEQPAA